MGSNVRWFTCCAAGTTVTGWTARALPAGAAGLAVAFAATSLTGVLAGGRWWGFVVLSVAVVTAAGMVLRWLQTPPIVAAAGQLAALVGLVTAVFTSSGWLVVLPGSAARSQLAAVLERAAQQIRVGVPPVPESTELLCLLVIVVGLVAVAVDILAVSVGAPASAGLVLLCVVTVPVATSDRMLPWWSFALSAVGFALLLAVDTARRQVGWGESVESGSVGPGRQLTAAPAAVAMSAGALVVALLIGATVTAVGSSRPISAGDRTKAPATGIGLNPFTSLRGQLSTEEVVPLLRVRGLGQRAYLRALTLSRFTNGVGWQPGPLDPAVPAGDEKRERLPLPAGVAIPISGSTVRVEIEPISYADNWLPSFGFPLALGGISPDWRYDPNAITVFSEHRQRAEPYTELGVLPTADPRLLHAVGPAGSAPFAEADPRYLETGGVDQRVVQLATQVTAGTRTAFDATMALNRWFTQPSNGFRYELRTAPGNSGDALVDFLFTGHRGYCEQFASAMAIMLRTLRVPARVAVGFTPGTVTGDSRLITTEDAHAWVEVWFPGAGWLPFDPTPLSDGRAVPPAYLTSDPPSSGVTPPAEPPTATVPAPRPGVLAAAPAGLNTADAGVGAGMIVMIVTGLLGLGALAGLTPLGIREFHRRRRRHLVNGGGPRAVSAAWQEVMAESADRGVLPPVGETVRASAARLVNEHGLDAAGRAGLRTLIGEVERSWYASALGSAGGSRRGEHQPSSTDGELRCAMESVLASMTLSAPLTRSARLLPRSVLPRHRTR
jgi:transglutaminase-like putative cysteine protease